jgi:hypothetical protein
MCPPWRGPPFVVPCAVQHEVMHRRHRDLVPAPKHNQVRAGRNETVGLHLPPVLPVGLKGRRKGASANTVGQGREGRLRRKSPANESFSSRRSHHSAIGPNGPVVPHRSQHRHPAPHADRSWHYCGARQPKRVINFSSAGATERSAPFSYAVATLSARFAHVSVKGPIFVDVAADESF